MTTTIHAFKINMLDNLVKNIYINTTAILSTVGLSIMQALAFLDGVLPTVSLLLTTISVGTLLYFNIKIKGSESRIKELEIEKLRKELHGE